jgi:transposase
MKRYVEGEARSQATLFPDTLEDYIAEDNPVRVVDAFVDELDLRKLGFDGVEPEPTGRPAYADADWGSANRAPATTRPCGP